MSPASTRRAVMEPAPRPAELQSEDEYQRSTLRAYDPLHMRRRAVSRLQMPPPATDKYKKMKQ
jgi:hypothetical protein